MVNYRKAIDHLMPSNVPPAFDAIRSFELRHGVKLPEDYLDFLWFPNGGSFRQRVVLIPSPLHRDPSNVYDVRSFHPFSCDFDFSVLDSVNDAEDQFSPKEGHPYLAIASSSISTRIAMSFAASGHGSIWYLWKEFGENGELNPQFECVANSFTSFLEQLIYDPEETAFYEVPFSFAEYGDLEQLQTLVVRSHFKELRAADGASLLEVAALMGQSRAVEFLLRAGADPNASCGGPGNLGEPLLIAAVGTGCADIVRLLLAFGADPNAVSVKGAPALVCCCDGIPNIRILRLLLNAGANPTARDRDNRGPVDAMREIEHWKYSPKRYALHLLGIK